ncbi:uncharacterized protein LOC117328134 [Pecten maximus]|uniref:uncharacterized protein LOC117328134 n=1 Tax=Pecten maximus TaxID=6579 RepID=UPI0014582245|nr:uncharacterized protein LOC117328134 [Pecten maximus]
MGQILQNNSATNDEIGQHNLVILPCEETTSPVRENLATLKEGQIRKFMHLSRPKDDVFSSAKGYRLETENIKESQQDQLANLSAIEGQGRIREFVHLSRPKDEVFSSVKRYRLETENLKYQLEDRAATEVNVGCRNIPDTRITRKRESSIKEHINKTCVSKESKSTVTLNDIKRSYNVVLNRWTDWETPPIKMNVPSTLRNKSPVPNLVSVFSLVPEVSDRKEDGTIGNSSDDMDLLAGGCDSPMWLSSESSGADSPTCVDDTGLTDNALAGCTEEDRPPDNLKKCREEYVTSVDGEYLSDRLHHQLKTGYRNGPPSDNTIIRNVSNTATNGQGAYLLSDDVIAMRHFYHC